MRLFSRKKKEDASKQKLSELLRGHEPPTFPQGTLRLLKLLRDEDAEITQLADALAWDPGLVVRLLKTVNSAAFGLSRRIDCVQHAASILGRSKLEQLVLGIAVKDNLPRAKAPGFDAERFWRAAFFRAALASKLAAELHPADMARSFTGGLLQDMAIPVLAQARPAEYGAVLEAWHEVPASELHLLERSALGWSHDEVGEHLALAWDLPDSLTCTIASHHSANPLDDEELPPALRLVACHRETSSEHGIEAIVEESRGYGLASDWVQEMVLASEEQAAELAQAL